MPAAVPKAKSAYDATNFGASGETRFDLAAAGFADDPAADFEVDRGNRLLADAARQAGLLRGPLRVGLVFGLVELQRVLARRIVVWNGVVRSGVRHERNRVWFAVASGTLQYGERRGGWQLAPFAPRSPRMARRGTIPPS
jgi:hypothetical protein